MFWLGLLVGALLGATSGYLICAMFTVAKDADERHERALSRLREQNISIVPDPGHGDQPHDQGVYRR
jgi:hypothetical protein